MISDVLAEAEEGILFWLKDLDDGDGCDGDDILRAQMKSILALMRYVVADLLYPEGPGITEFPHIASIRASRDEINSELLPIAEKIRGIFRDHGMYFRKSPHDTQDD